MSGWLEVQADFAALRGEMVERQIRARGIRDARVLQAMRSVPRHFFVPEDYRAAAYEDRPLPIGDGQTISQPYMVAAMTAALEPPPDGRVLEVGTGSGYQAAVLASLVRVVYSIERHPRLAARAQSVLASLTVVDAQAACGIEARKPRNLRRDRAYVVQRRCRKASACDADARRLFNPEVESGIMIIQDGVILASHAAPASPLGTGIIVSLDMGKTWAQYDLKEFGKRSACRFHEKNGEGWFRVDLRSGWIQRAEVLFIKPK